MTAAERETGVAEGAADPLADVRVRADRHEQEFAGTLASWSHDVTVREWALAASDRVRVLAALDAERAEKEALQAGAVLTLMALGRAGARAERAEAAIARARAEHQPRHVRTRSNTCQSDQHEERPDCWDEYDECVTCEASDRYEHARYPCPTVAALETETPGMRTPGGMWTLEPLGCRARGEPHDYASPPEGWTPPPVDLELGLVRVCTRCGAVESTLRAPS